MSDEQLKSPPISERLFEYNLVTLPWIVFVGGLFVFIGIPFARVLVVYLVKGATAYSRQGIRIPNGKHPLHFTDGTVVPELPYFLTNLVVFVVIVGGLSLLLIHSIRFYERHFKGSRSARL